MKSKYTKRRRHNKQRGGVRSFSNIITAENMNQHYGKLVQIRLTKPWINQFGEETQAESLPWSTSSPVRRSPWDSHHVNTELIGQKYRLVEITRESRSDRQWFPVVSEGVIRLNGHELTYNRDGILQKSERNDFPYYFEVPKTYEELLYIINTENMNHMGYIIELYEPHKRDFLTRRSIVDRTAQRRQNRLDREAFKTLATSRRLRELPSDIKEHILSSMDVEPRHNRRIFPRSEYLDPQSLRTLFDYDDY